MNSWTINTVRVEKQIEEMPAKVQAKILRILELIQDFGTEVKEPHIKSIGHGLFEIRAKTDEGNARVFFCFAKNRHVILLHAFLKKTQKIPLKELNIARERLKEVEKDEPCSIKTKATR